MNIDQSAKGLFGIGSFISNYSPDNLGVTSVPDDVFSVVSMPNAMLCSGYLLQHVQEANIHCIYRTREALYISIPQAGSPRVVLLRRPVDLSSFVCNISHSKRARVGDRDKKPHPNHNESI